MPSLATAEAAKELMMFETAAARAARIARMREALSHADSLSQADKKAILSIDYFEFPLVITAHRGHRPSMKLQSLEEARRQFDLSCRDLSDLLGRFHTFSDGEEFSHRSGRAQLEELVDRVRKELFTISTLAHSIQDHCRRVQEVWNAPEFRDKLAEFFGSDGLHEFVIMLRTALHHIRIFEANWALRWSEGGAKSAHFTLKKFDLLNDLDDWGRGVGFLTAQPEEIDVRELVANYRSRHAGFYDWYVAWCDAHLPPEVAEYRELSLEKLRSSVRMSWSFLLGEFIRRKVDPVAYLAKVLTDEEVAEAATMPGCSAELADFVITKADEYGACNEDIRSLVHTLFGVSPARVGDA